MNLEFSHFKESITPPEKINLVGQARRNQHAETLGPSELYVRILWLKADTDLVFITTDSLYFSRHIANIIVKYTSDKYHVPEDRIIFNASHTHSAPGHDLEFFGHIDEAYLNDVEDKIKIGLSKCKTSFMRGYADFSTFENHEKLFISRRKFDRDIKTFFLKKRIILAPNEMKPVDNTINLVKLYDEGLNLHSLVYNLSCHPVFNVSEETSADFVGAISQELEKRICKFALFLQGFAGDIRPNYTQTKVPMTDTVNFLKLLVNKKVFSNYDQQNFKHFYETITRLIIQDAAERDMNILNDAKKLHTDTHMYDDSLESRTGKTRKRVAVKLAKISDNLFISLPAEVLSSYVNMLRDKFPKFRIFPLGYADGMIGYLPTENEVYEGGYEVERSYRYYDWDDHISASSIKKFTERLISEISDFLKSI